MRKTLDRMLDVMDQQKEQQSTGTLADLPPDVSKQLLACHAVTDEFLQQFWQAVSPSLDNDADAAGSNLPERAAKARKMLDVLAQTNARVKKIADLAEDGQPGFGSEFIYMVRPAPYTGIQRDKQCRAACDSLRREAGRIG